MLGSSNILNIIQFTNSNSKFYKDAFYNQDLPNITFRNSSKNHRNVKSHLSSYNELETNDQNKNDLFNLTQMIIKKVSERHQELENSVLSNIKQNKIIQNKHKTNNHTLNIIKNDKPKKTKQLENYVLKIKKSQLNSSHGYRNYQYRKIQPKKTVELRTHSCMKNQFIHYKWKPIINYDLSKLSAWQVVDDGDF